MRGEFVQGGRTTRFWSAAAGFLIKVACFLYLLQVSFFSDGFILKRQKGNLRTNIQEHMNTHAGVY